MTMAQDINVKSNPEERTLGSSVILGVVIGGLLGLGVGYMAKKAAETVGAALGDAAAAPVAAKSYLQEKSWPKTSTTTSPRHPPKTFPTV
jgi:uncharacterized protein YcfJ